MRMKWISAALALVVLASAVAWWASHRPRQAAALDAGAYALRYDFAIELATADGSKQKVEAAFDGTLHLLASTEDKGVMKARVRVENLQRNEGATKMGFLQEGADDALASPFMLSMASNGRVKEVQLAEDLPLATKSILSTIATGSQYVERGDLAAKEWRAQEADMNGKYQATYEFTGADAVRKAWALGQGDPFGAVAGKAEANYTLDGARVASMILKQEGDTLVGSVAGPRSPFRLQLSLKRVGDADAAWVNAEASLVAALKPFDTRAGAPKNIRVAYAEPRPKDELLTALSQVTEDATLSKHTQLRAELTEAVIRDTSVADALDGLMRVKEVPVYQARYAAEALLGARTAHADRLTAALVTDRKVSSMVRTMLLAGLTLLEQPQPRTVHAAREVMKSGSPAEKGQAAMALAGVSSNISYTRSLSAGGDPGVVPPGELGDTPVVPEAPPGGGNPPGDQEGQDDTEQLPDADALAEEIIAMARRFLDVGPNDPPVTFGWKVTFLRALGNLGTPECIPLVRIGLGDDNLLVRAVAANALRFQDPAVVKDDIAKGMADPEFEVRAAIIKAARKMGPAATRDIVQTALFFDTSEYVRLQAVYTFGAWAREAPSLMATLSQAAEHEKSPQVMQAIRAMLNKNRVEPPFVKHPLSSAD